jgi:hypothetical protein
MKEVDHEADDLARGEVLAGGLVGELGELADELLVEVAHLDVADLVGVEVDLGHPGQDEVEQLRPVEPPDLGVEVELLDDVAGVGIEGGDPGPQVAGDLGWVGEDASQGQAAGVVDIGEAGDRLQDRANVRDLALERGQAVENLLLARLEDAVEATQHDERQDRATVLGPLVVAAKEVGDRPDKASVVVDRARDRQAVRPPRGRPFNSSRRKAGSRGHAATVIRRRPRPPSISMIREAPVNGGRPTDYSSNSRRPRPAVTRGGAIPIAARTNVGLGDPPPPRRTGWHHSGGPPAASVGTPERPAQLTSSPAGSDARLSRRRTARRRLPRSSSGSMDMTPEWRDRQRPGRGCQ